MNLMCRAVLGELFMFETLNLCAVEASVPEAGGAIISTPPASHSRTEKSMATPDASSYRQKTESQRL